MVEIGAARLADDSGDLYYFYRLISTTANFDAGYTIAGTYNQNGQGLASRVEEATLRHTLSLCFEIRGVNLGSLADGWLNLGFDLDGNPLAGLGAVALAKPVSESQDTVSEIRNGASR